MPRHTEQKKSSPSMNSDKKRHTNDSFPQESAFYPLGFSDRAAVLIEELDATQALQLYNELKTRTYEDWLDWLEDARAEIAKYDYLTRSERKARLQKPTDIQSLFLHHACVFVELWRARLAREYFHLPPSGGPLETAEEQREMMLAVAVSYHKYHHRDLWPFECPDCVDLFPFRRDE